MSALVALVAPAQSLAECACAMRRGRSLETGRQAVGRGCVLLRERAPYCGVSASPPHCCCQEGPLLAEHITLALAIVRQGPRNKQKLKRFMQELYSGLQPSGEGKESTSPGSITRGNTTGSRGSRSNSSSSRAEGEKIGVGKSVSVPVEGSSGGIIVGWGVRDTCLLALCCAVSCLYCACEGVNLDLLPPRATKAAFNAPKKDEKAQEQEKEQKGEQEKEQKGEEEEEDELCFGWVRRARLVADSWAMLQVLGRLPQNAHAISRVITAAALDTGAGTRAGARTEAGGQEMEEVRQERVGYAIYLSASAVNHSCRPNASYPFPAYCRTRF